MNSHDSRSPKYESARLKEATIRVGPPPEPSPPVAAKPHCALSLTQSLDTSPSVAHPRISIHASLAPPPDLYSKVYKRLKGGHFPHPVAPSRPAAEYPSSFQGHPPYSLASHINCKSEVGLAISTIRFASASLLLHFRPSVGSWSTYTFLQQYPSSTSSLYHQPASSACLRTSLLLVNTDLGW